MIYTKRIKSRRQSMAKFKSISKTGKYSMPFTWLSTFKSRSCSNHVYFSMSEYTPWSYIRRKTINIKDSK